MNRVSARRPRLLVALCALLSLAMCVLAAGSALSLWATCTLANASGEACLDSRVEMSLEDGRSDDGDGTSDTAMGMLVGEEEERHDEPIAKVERRIIENSQHGRDLKAWERIAFARPVIDIVAECPSPPPRA